jgi:two-component system sensor histidine kinase VicK
MLKSVQIKIVLAFMILGILMLGIQGILFASQLQEISQEVINNQMLEQMIIAQIKQTQFITILSICLFTIISILVGIFVAKVIIKPIARLTKSAEQVAKGGQYQIKYLNDGKNKTEVDELTKAFGMMHDELNENLKEVSRQKKQIETILLHMSDGILAFNKNGEVIHKNRAAEKLFGLNGDEKTFNEIFSKIDDEVNLEKIIYLENWTSTQAKVIVGEKTLSLFFAPFRDEAERPGGAIVVIQDITEHVKLDSMRTEFVADVSHELKTPITSILGYADTLLEDDCDEETSKKFLKRISSQANRMAELVTDLLTLSRYDADMIKNRNEEFDLGELVKTIYDSLSFEIEKKNQKAECFVTADVPHVVADKAGIERVITNILTNAIKYTPENGEIKIYVGFVYNDAYIKVIDTGIGIPEEDLEKVFERFYRVDKARTREMGGTGLGLSIAKEILDKNNSKINIKSELGKGTEVVIRIPTKRNEENKDV